MKMYDDTAAGTVAPIPPGRDPAYEQGYKLISAISGSISKCLKVTLTQAFANPDFRNAIESGVLPHFVSLLLLDFCGRPFNKTEIRNVVEALGFKFSLQMADLISSFRFGSHFVAIALSAFLESSGAVPLPESVARLEMAIGVAPNFNVTAEAIAIYKSVEGRAQGEDNGPDAQIGQEASMLKLAESLSGTVHMKMDAAFRSYLGAIPTHDKSTDVILPHFFAAIALMFAGRELVDSETMAKLLLNAGATLDDGLARLITDQMGKNYLIYIAAAFTLLAAGRTVDEKSMLGMLRALSVRPSLSAVKDTIAIVGKAQ